MLEIRVEFILKFGAPYAFSSSTIPVRTSALNHKTLDDSMKNQPIIIAITSMCDEVFASFGTFGLEQIDVNITSVCLNNGLDRRLVGSLLLFCLWGYEMLVLLVGTLVENISAWGVFIFWVFRFPSTEEVKSIFLKSRCNNERIGCNFFSSSCSLRIFHRLSLEYTEFQETFGVFALTDDKS